MTGRLEPPDWYGRLSPDAADQHRQLWDDTVRRLTSDGGVFRAEPRLIDAYVCAAIQLDQASQLIAQTGLLITTGGKVGENPALPLQRRAAADLAKASKALGLHRATPMRAVSDEAPMRGDGRKWCAEHERWECKHPRKDGSPCHGHPPMPGTGACRMHVGMTPAAAREKAVAFRARMFAEPLDIDPAGALLDVVQWQAGHVAGLRKEVQELAEAEGPDGEPGSGLWWGLTRESVDADGGVEREYRAGPHVILKEYNAGMDRLIRAAAAAESAGAQAEAVTVAKALGAGVTGFLDRIFRAVRLEPWQWELVPEVVPPLLAELGPGADEEAGHARTPT